MWEQRYRALTPDRSEGNTRYYNNTQLRRLLNIVSLIDLDYKVSELCSMPDKKLFQLVDQHANNRELNGDQNGYFIAQLIKAGMSYDEAWFEKIFSHCALRLGIRNTYTKIIYPMLVRIGLMWASNTAIPAYEHFISNIIRKKLFTAIDALPPPTPEADSWLLFLPEDEFHEIGLLLSSYLIQLSGKKAIYLGANIPLTSLSSAISETTPSRLLSFFVHRDAPEDQQTYLETISNIFPSKKIYISVSLPLNDHLKTIKKFNWLHSVEDLERELL